MLSTYGWFARGSAFKIHEARNFMLESEDQLKNKGFALSDASWKKVDYTQ